MALVNLNGELLDSEKAGIPVTDQGFLLGHGFYETIRVAGGEPKHLDKHETRFCRSVDRLQLSVPNFSTIAKRIEELIQVESIDEARLRISVTGGSAPLPKNDGEALILISWAKMSDYGPSAKAVVVPFRRNEHGALTGIKSLSYGENMIAMRWAKDRGYDEAIFLNTAGNLCEGATTNIFLICRGTVMTPSLDSGCLPGVMREVVIEKFDVCEKDISGDDIETAEAAFLTSSLRGVHPISLIGEKKLDVDHQAFSNLMNFSDGK